MTKVLNIIIIILDRRAIFQISSKVRYLLRWNVLCRSTNWFYRRFSKAWTKKWQTYFSLRLSNFSKLLSITRIISINIINKTLHVNRSIPMIFHTFRKQHSNRTLLFIPWTKNTLVLTSLYFMIPLKSVIAMVRIS